MKKIDTTSWKEFRISQIFITEGNGAQVPTGVYVPKTELKEYGSTPRITVTGINNGVFGYFDYIGNTTKNYRVFENFISISFLGTVFYQQQKASLDMKVHCLKPIGHELNVYTGEFLVSAIKSSLKSYKYGDQLSSTLLPKLYVYLPANGDAPDWEYMENFMHNIQQRVRSSITALSDAKYHRHEVNYSFWKEFIVGNVFEISRPSARVATEFEEGDTPFVASGNENNGVEKYVNAKDILLDKKGCISVSPVDGSCFYQPIDFVGRGGAGSSIILLRNDKLKSYNAFYICSVLRRVCSKYNYSNMGSASSIKGEKIKLPATPAGEPDWHYMEMYMRGVEAIVKNKLALLVPHKPEVAIKDAATVNFNNANVTYIDKSTNYNIKK